MGPNDGLALGHHRDHRLSGDAMVTWEGEEAAAAVDGDVGDPSSRSGCCTSTVGDSAVASSFVDDDDDPTARRGIFAAALLGGSFS